MKIYTKTGDKGTTSLVGGTRVPKFHERLDCYGTIDELNSHIGLVLDISDDIEIQKVLQNVQHKLFNIGSYLATEDEAKVNKKIIIESDIEFLEKLIDVYTHELPLLQNFILPSGHYSASSTHIARTVCRRAERLLVKLSQSTEIDENVIKYINRLSDFLFVLARIFLKKLNKPEIHWNSDFVD